MNFSTKFLDDYRNNAEQKELYNQVLRAAKFVLPHNADCGLYVDTSLSQFLKLPYPEVVFEFTTDQSFGVSSTIILARQTGDTIIFRSISAGVVPWTPSVVEAELNVNTLGAVVNVLHEDMLSLVSITQGFSKTDIIGSFMHSLHLPQVLGCIAAMNTSNVETLTLPAPKFASRTRKAKGKAPLFDYKILSIFVGEVRNLRPQLRKNLGEKLISSDTRLTSVRGHFKRKGGKLYWWRAHLRGNKNAGEVFKDYKIAKE